MWGNVVVAPPFITLSLDGRCTTREFPVPILKEVGCAPEEALESLDERKLLLLSVIKP